VAAAQAGERAALDALLRRHYDRLYALCRRMTGDDADAADACQERRRRPEPGLPEGSAEVPAAVDLVEGLTTRLDLDHALQSLPADYRAAVVLRDVCGLSYDEIAQTLDIPPGTVRSRIARGRSALLPHLAPGRNRGPSSGRPTST
jgi:RNA polymerase sigma-70 factor (ECF subfamily)